MWHLPLPVPVQLVIINDIQVFPLFGIVSQPDIAGVYLFQAVVLQEGSDGEFGVHYVQNLQSGKVGSKLLIPFRKAGVVVPVVPFQLEVRGHFYPWPHADGEDVAIIKLADNVFCHASD